VVKIKPGSTPKIMEPTKCDEIGWFKINQLPNTLSIITKHDITKFTNK